jgi:hypothetical protein
LKDLDSQSRNAQEKKKAAVDLDEDVKVGEGDDFITDWYEGFDVIDEIQACLFEGFESEWDKIEADLAQYPRKTA